MNIYQRHCECCDQGRVPDVMCGSFPPIRNWFKPWGHAIRIEEPFLVANLDKIGDWLYGNVRGGWRYAGTVRANSMERERVRNHKDLTGKFNFALIVAVEFKKPADAILFKMFLSDLER